MYYQHCSRCTVTDNSQFACADNTNENYQCMWNRLYDEIVNASSISTFPPR